jgi:hypothetical protein
MAKKVVKETVKLEEYDEVGAIIDYENGVLDEEQAIELFQHLVDNGHAWSMQGSYGRTAKALIDAKLVHTNKVMRKV